MLLVESDAVVVAVTVVCFGDQFSADSHLGGKADDTGADLVLDQICDRLVYVAWVGCVEGAEDKENLSCSVNGGVEEVCSSHLECIY